MSFSKRPHDVRYELIPQIREPHAPEFKIDKAQLEAVRDLCYQLSKNLPIDYDHPSDGLIQDVKSREEDLEDDVGEADVLEREDLETSRICVDDHGTFTLVMETPVTLWDRKKAPCLCFRSKLHY
jgi:hypothetical protein